MKRNKLIPLSAPDFDQEVITLDALGDPETVITDFESKVTTYTGRKYAVALHSGTASIHLALRVLGIQKGDVVLCQTFTYAATAFPIIYEGATPVFIDSERDTWNMDPVLLDQACKELIAQGRRPSAIIVVDLFGMPAKMNELQEIARKYDIPVVEDAAEALGSVYQGRKCGNFGEISILSFNSNKIITSSGGGMLLTDNEAYAKRALYYSKQAKDPGDILIHRETGYNYRMSHVNAAIGHSQFSLLADRIEARRSNYEYYSKHLKDLDGISFLPEPAGSFSNRWLTTLLIDPNLSGGIGPKDLMVALKADNIEARPVWNPLHLQPVFSGCKAHLSGVAGSLFEQGICLPSGSFLNLEDLNRVVSVVRDVVK